ncbi:MAG TPA: glycosyltransferase, partial [Candidatus Acidoferrales bacterium]|nr:glycosyltransferase [Candidatus Acidoferrales bacterium]
PQIDVFGPKAEQVARRLPELSAVLTDVSHLLHGHERLIRRRMEGKPFYGMLLWDDRRATIARNFASALLAQFLHLDDRHAAFDALANGTLSANGVQVSALAAFNQEARSLAAEFARLSNTQLFFSEAERERFVNTFGVRRNAEIIDLPHELPNFDRTKPADLTVVIWAPDLTAIEVSVEALAFEEWHAQTFVVCRTGSLAVRARFLRPDDADVPRLLGEASVVIDASLSDTGAALAFAEHEVPLAVTVTSGAHESIKGAVPYDPWNWRSVMIAASRAAGRPTRLRHARRTPPSELAISSRSWGKDPPLVSVFTPTYNRLADLEEMLESLAAQTYPNIEVVVLNDGGQSPAEVCARFPQLQIKLIDRTENVGVTRAVGLALTHCTGKYIAGLADDDRHSSDHFERLVDALELCGSVSVAFSDCIIRFVRKDEDGSLVERAFNSSHYVEEADPSSLLASSAIPMLCLLIRAEFLPEITFETGISCSDVDLTMSLIERADFIHVAELSSTWTLRDDGTNYSARVDPKEHEQSMRFMYAKHPVPGRPVIEALREQQIVLNCAPTSYTYVPTFELQH